MTRMGAGLGGISCVALACALAVPGWAAPTPWTPEASTAGARTQDAGIQDEVVLITGSTSGLGRELALRLAAGGAHVIVHGRSAERGAEAVREIQEVGRGSASFYAADLASLDQVRELARTIHANYDRLDVLVNNAGIGSARDGRQVSEDGHELVFQVTGDVGSGRHFNGLDEARAHDQAYDEGARERLRRLSRELVGLDPA